MRICLISLEDICHLHTVFVKAFVEFPSLRMTLKHELLFFFSAEQWHELPNFPNPNKWGYSMVSLNNNVYVTGESSACNR